MKSLPGLGFVMKYVVTKHVAVGRTFSCFINEPCLKVSVFLSVRTSEVNKWTVFIFVVQCEDTVKKAQHSSYIFIARGLMNVHFFSTYGVFCVCLSV